jgi:hypothetical protein
MPQDKSLQAKTLLKEVEVYRSHCLFVEAKKRANDLVAFIDGEVRIRNKDRILQSLQAKIREIDEEADAFEAVALSPRLTAADKARIRKVFSSAYEDGTDAAIYEAATAFQVFGQFEEALAEFRKLVKSKGFRVTAVKNIFRCYIGLSSVKKAVALYLKLYESGSFPPEELGRVRHFLHSVLKMKGISKELPAPETILKLPPKKKQNTPPAARPVEKPKPTPPEPEEIVLEPSLDILSVTLNYPDAKKEKKTIVLDINFQRKNLISMIVPKGNKDLLAYLKPAMRIENLQLSSTDVIFIDDGIVHGLSEIRVGEKQGDYTLTIKLEST